MSYNSSHLRTNCINFSSISEDKTRQHSLQANTRSVVEETLTMFTLLESSRYRPVRTRSVTSNILARQRRRNGTETWRRRYCQCEHLRLITHEKILLNGDVPRRNGNVTYSVFFNRPSIPFEATLRFKVIPQAVEVPMNCQITICATTCEKFSMWRNPGRAEVVPENV